MASDDLTSVGGRHNIALVLQNDVSAPPNLGDAEPQATARTGRLAEAMRVRGIRAAVVGAGFIGRVHAFAARASGATVVGIADRDLQDAEALAAEIGALSSETAAERLIARPDVDVVHICTPNASHVALVEQAVAAGKHVICEKPLATSLAEALRLQALVQTAGLVGTVPFIYRYYPMARQLRAMATAGELGQVNVAHGSYLQDWLADRTDTDWRVSSELGGASRAFGDIGVHWTDLFEFTSGQRITRLTARLKTVFPTRYGPSGAVPVQTEDAATVMFETDSGAIGSVVLSQVALGRKNRLWLSLDGSHLSAVFDHEAPEHIWLGAREANKIVLRSPSSLGPAAARFSSLPAGHPQGFQDCFSSFVHDSYLAIRGQSVEGLPLFVDGVRAAAITQAVLESEAGGGWVQVAG